MYSVDSRTRRGLADTCTWSLPISHCFSAVVEQYLVQVSEIATKGIESVQAKQQRAAVSQKAVETKQLSPRLAGEWLGIPNTTVYLHVAKKYAKFGAGRPAVGAVLGEGGQKSIVQSCQLFPDQQAFGLQHAYLCITDFNHRIYFVHIYIDQLSLESVILL